MYFIKYIKTFLLGKEWGRENVTSLILDIKKVFTIREI